MNEIKAKAIQSMLQKYNCNTQADYENSLKEIMQQIALLALSRTDFFSRAAFYGGTALRILHGIDRFSEDLDFSLLDVNLGFSLEEYNKAVVDELKLYGLESSIATKNKNIESNIKTAELQSNVKRQFISINVPEKVSSQVHREKIINIKMEVDTNPPLNFSTESNAITQPVFFKVSSFTLEDLFAGKISALLSRQWKNRVKGRDWYDYMWLIQKDVSIGITHLKERLEYNGFLQQNNITSLDLITLKNIIHEKIDSTNFDSAIEDIRKYIKDFESISYFNAQVFHDLTDNIKVTK